MRQTSCEVKYIIAVVFRSWSVDRAKRNFKCLAGYWEMNTKDRSGVRKLLQYLSGIAAGWDRVSAGDRIEFLNDKIRPYTLFKRLRETA